MVDINEIKEYLVKQGVKPSYSRLKVMEYLMKYRNHPTADEIYCELIKEIPTLSKTTVYNTLNLFVEGKLVVPVSIEGNEIRYDATVEEHGHFKCESCGDVTDFPIKQEAFPNALEGYTISNKHVYYKGICPKCLNKI